MLWCENYASLCLVLKSSNDARNKRGIRWEYIELALAGRVGVNHRAVPPALFLVEPTGQILTRLCGTAILPYVEGYDNSEVSTNATEKIPQIPVA